MLPVTIRITLISKVSIRQLKYHVHNCCRIDCLAVSKSGFKPHLVCGRHSSLIESMAQTPDYAIHVQLPVRRELHFQQHFAFQF
jgi:hypothetical protein